MITQTCAEPLFLKEGPFFKVFWIERLSFGKNMDMSKYIKGGQNTFKNCKAKSTDYYY